MSLDDLKKNCQWHIHSGQQNAISIFVIWIYLQAGKIKLTLCFYWLLWYDELILPAGSCKKTFLFGHIINESVIDRACSVKMAGYCRQWFLFLFMAL